MAGRGGRGKAKGMRVSLMIQKGDTSEESTLAAAYSKDRRTSQGTKDTYGGEILLFKQWCLDNGFAHCVGENGEVITPFDSQAIQEFFGFLCRPAYRRIDLPGPFAITEETETEPYSHDTVVGYRSALVSLYANRGLKMEDSLDTMWKQLLEGYYNVTNDLKKRSLMKLSTGKREMRLDGYKLLAKKILGYTPPERQGSFDTGIFAWSYFLLMWNLIARPEMIDDLTLERITWRNDCLAITDQVDYHNECNDDLAY